MKNIMQHCRTHMEVYLYPHCISQPKHNMMIQLPMEQKKPENVGEALEFDLREYWIQYIYNFTIKFTIKQ